MTRLLIPAVVFALAAPRLSIPPRGTVGLPQIGLPLPQIGLPPHGVQVPTTDRRGGGRHRHGWSAPWPPVVYFVPQHVAPIALASQPAPIEVEVEKPAATGRLILDAQPETAQVFVDGYYAGAPRGNGSLGRR